LISIPIHITDALIIFKLKLRADIMNKYLFIKALKLFLLISISLFATACMMQRAHTNAQWQNLSNSSNYTDNYIVQSGDSLSSIAARYGLDFREIAAFNNIAPPYRIYKGQNLRIPARSMPVASSPPSTNQGKMRQLHPRFSKQSFSQQSTTYLNSSGICYPSPAWQWPSRGTVQPTVSSTGTQGIHIFGRFGQAIQAAAAGTVLYSGQGVNGYKNLIIIQHDNGFISAYSNNRRRRVSEGQYVAAGQIIAEMGQNNRQYPLLHFEIRCQDRAVDPLYYLPR